MHEPRSNSRQKVAYVFPGQGSHWVGMGHDLYKSSSQARAVFEAADEALRFPLSRLCFYGPEEELRQTRNAQPAIVTMSIACLKAAATVANATISGQLAFVAGHSLGEYTALIAARVLDFSDGIRLVKERGRLMQEACGKRAGGMAAIIGITESSVEEVCWQTGTQIANLNSADQIVISGERRALARAIDLARAIGAKRVIELPVSGAFHSSLMRPATEGMLQAISKLHFNDPEIPIVVNSTASPVMSAEAVKEELARQLCNCVRWHRSVEYMIQAGVSTFVEIGPGRVLSGIIKRIDKNVQTVNLNDAASLTASAE